MATSPVKEDATPEELQELLKEHKDNSARLQQQVKALCLRNELEAEKMQQQQWELAIEQLKHSCELMAQQHELNMNKIRCMAEEATKETGNQAVAWMRTQLPGGKEPVAPFDIIEEETPHNRLLITQLKKQQDELQKQIDDLTTGKESTADIADLLKSNMSGGHRDKSQQELLLEQICTTLAPKDADKDPNKALLRALITAQNKTAGKAGTSTLRPDLLHKLTGDGEFSMAEWLASLNRQEEGESEINKAYGRWDDDFDCRADCKHSKMRSACWTRPLPTSFARKSGHRRT